MLFLNIWVRGIFVNCKYGCCFFKGCWFFNFAVLKIRLKCFIWEVYLVLIICKCFFISFWFRLRCFNKRWVKVWIVVKGVLILWVIVCNNFILGDLRFLIVDFSDVVVFCFFLFLL